MNIRSLAVVAHALPMFWICEVAHAHGFDERYDLPVPLGHVLVAACAVVLLTFLAAVMFMRTPLASPMARPGLVMRVPRPVLLSTRTVSAALFLLAVACGLWGTPDPLMNLAPTLVWIVWWVGMCFTCALICNIWPLLDPWRTAHDVLDALARRAGRPLGISLHWRWPPVLGLWPATLLLLAWSWLEVVQPLASTPFKLGVAALLWSTVNLAGMVMFGRVSWQANADVFAVMFSTLGRMAPLRLSIEERHAAARETVGATAGQIAFVMAMLSTVIFDGLHGGAAWLTFEGALKQAVPSLIDVNGRFAGTAGLIAVWLGFLLAYRMTLHITLALLKPHARKAALGARLALTLVPIAAAYNIAHNFSSLAIQGQNVVQLLSDPFGRQWDLLGTARWHPDIGLVDARLTWIVAVVAIVAGHMLSVWWSHRVALAAGVPSRRAALAMLPMTVLMVAYTAISLTLIAEPMVVPQTASTMAVPG